MKINLKEIKEILNEKCFLDFEEFIVLSGDDKSFYFESNKYTIQISNYRLDPSLLGIFVRLINRTNDNQFIYMDNKANIDFKKEVLHFTHKKYANEFFMNIKRVIFEIEMDNDKEQELNEIFT